MSVALTAEPATRPDAFGKAAGAARYTQDIQPAGTLHGYVLRSRRAGAAIEGLDLGPARSLPGVHAVHAVDAASEVNSADRSETSSGTWIAPTSAYGTRTYSACAPAKPPSAWLYAKQPPTDEPHSVSVSAGFGLPLSHNE